MLIIATLVFTACQKEVDEDTTINNENTTQGLTSIVDYEKQHPVTTQRFAGDEDIDIEEQPTTAEVVTEETTNTIEIEEIVMVEEYAPEPEGCYEEYYEETYWEYSDVTPGDFMNMGVYYWNGWRWTWYSENVLPGGGLNIPGRWSDTDFVRDEYGNICIASSDLSYGTIVDTPWGTGCVYDSGCSSGTLDVYVTW